MFLSISPFQGKRPEHNLDVLTSWWPALLAVTLIACESNSYFSSARTSAWVLPIWQTLFGPIATGDWLHIHAMMRKTAHFMGYGVLGFIFLKAWMHTLVRRSHLLLSKAGPASAGLAILTSILVASADELHQTMIPQRTGRWQDVVIDTSGTILAAILFLAFTLLRRSLAQSPRQNILPTTEGNLLSHHRVAPSDLRRCA